MATNVTEIEIKEEVLVKLPIAEYPPIARIHFPVCNGRAVKEMGFVCIETKCPICKGIVKLNHPISVPIEYARL